MKGFKVKSVILDEMVIVETAVQYGKEFKQFGSDLRWDEQTKSRLSWLEYLNGLSTRDKCRALATYMNIVNN